jgi:flagellar biosynthesis protein FlhF
MPAAELHDFREQLRRGLAGAGQGEASLIEQLAGDRAAAASRVADRAAPPAGELLERLRDCGVGEPTARRWLSQLAAQDPDAVHEPPESAWRRLRHLVASEVSIHGPLALGEGRPAVVALVGPTGVGKTTTLAKLAAHYHLAEQKRVGLIAADNYRIAAALQLKSYCKIMSLPMEVVASGGEMAAAVQRLAHLDLLLIDTAGVGPADRQRLKELQSLLAAARPTDVSLVLSCAADAASMQAAAEAMSILGTTNVILTKLDEVPRPGAIADGLGACRLPVSYLTHGQNVPADIELASARRVAEWIVGQA